MAKHYQPSLHARLIHLVLLAVLPALALMLYSAGEQQAKDNQDAKREALRLVRVVAASQQRLVDSTRYLLIALSRLPEVRNQDGRACSALFATLLKEYPLYANLGAANTQGEQFCSARPLTRQINIGDRSYFQLAMQRRTFAIGNYQVGHATARASLNLGFPILRNDGSPAGVVFAALDLEPFNGVVGTVKLPDYVSLAVYDREGTVLARYPDTEELVGRSVPEAGIVKAALARGEGVTEAVGLDGKEHLYGFASIGDASNTGQIFLHIGIPTEVALADANRLMRRNLGALLLVSILALIAAWYGGHIFVLDQLRALVNTAERLGSGDLGARTGLPHDPNEIGRLAASFDGMAASLEAKRSEADAAGQRFTRNLERIKAQHEIDMAITSTLDLHPMLVLLLEKVDLILPGAVTTIRLINKETGKLEPAACRNIDEGTWRAGNPRPMHGFAKIVLENKIPLTVANVQTDPRNDGHRFALRFGLVSYLGIPLIVKDQILGVIAFYTKERHDFSDDEIDFLTTLAGQSAIAIHNTTLYNETRQSAGELAALHSLAIAATQSLDLGAILASAIEKITDIFHFDAIRIFLFDAEMNELRVAAVFEAEPELWMQLSSFQRGQGIVGRVAETGESLIFENIKNDPRYAQFSHSKILKHTGANFLAALPIVTKLKTWGVMVFVGKQTRRLLPHEARLLNSMTNQIGIAVENATLYSQTAAKAKELSALYSIAGIASESLDINTVLRKTMDKVLEIFAFDAARIYLRSDEGEEIRLVAHQGIPEGVPLVLQYKVGEGRLGRAIETGEAMFVENMATDPIYNNQAHNKHMLNAGFYSSFIIPLRIRGEGLGVMNFLGKKPYRFLHTDIQLINAVAYHLGVAVGNARLFSQLKKKTVELERASQGKDEFLGVISHELRTPLNVIKGYTEIMMQGILGDITEQQRRAMETIGNQSLELFNMINGVLQVTRIEAGAVHAATWEVNLGSLLDELQRNYSIPNGKDLTVSWDYPRDLPMIMTDAEKLKAVIQNLVNNAIKFTENGVVAVSLQYIVGADEIEFRIADTGIGIPEEKIKTIFDMFQQVDSSATRKFGGVGLGLYIVRKYTELLGGRVQVESELGQGSMFIVTLPANTTQSSATPPNRRHHVVSSFPADPDAEADLSSRVR
ncbi:MAG: GAF domain-containing protein [Candidatus Binatia bacterium]